MNRIDELFQQKQNNILTIYFTAGYPNLNDSETIIKELTKTGVDMIEVGMPFSDPIADGSVIQASSQVALQNGISIELIFSQLENIRQSTNVPLLMMGYLNPVLQYGMERFCEKASAVGIDGLILPDLPLTEFKEVYQPYFEKFNLKNVFLFSPETSDERIKLLDEAGSGFNYFVSASSTTGKTSGFSEEQINYFEKIKSLELKNPKMIGFGISNKETFETVCKYANGAIIGSAFIKHLGDNDNIIPSIKQFIKKII